MPFFGVIPWAILGYIGGRLFAKKGYSPKAGILIGIVLGPIALIACALLPMSVSGREQAELEKEIALEAAQARRTKDCPHCRKTVSAVARFCPRCNLRFEGGVISPSVANS